MGNFQKLKVWQRAKELAVFLYKLTGQGEFAKDWGLRDQIRRSAVSIPSNVAEGDELDTDRQSIKFFFCLYRDQLLPGRCDSRRRCNKKSLYPYHHSFKKY